MTSNTPNFITEVFNYFNKENLIYCVLRNYQKLPEDHGNDIDILLEKDKFHLAEKALTEVASKFDFVPLRTLSRQGYMGLYFIEKNTHVIILFDLYFHIYFKGIPVADTQFILRTRDRFKNFYVPSAGCEAAVTLPKELLMFGHVKKRETTRLRIAKCTNLDPVNFSKTLTPIFGEHLTTKLVTLSKDKKWQDIALLTNELRIKAARNAVVRHPPKQLLRWWRFLWNHLRLLLWARPGLFICLIGPDGSGKTTITTFLQENLVETIYKKYSFLHKDFGIIPQLKQLLGHKPESVDEKAPVSKYCGMIKPHSGIRSLIYINYYFIDFILGHFVVAYNKWKNGLIIADRYFYDYYYQLAHANAPRWYIHFLSKFIPKPDITICLTANAETIHRRKPELTRKEIDRQITTIQSIAKGLPNPVWIDTGCSKTTTEKKLRQEIFTLISTQPRR